MFERHRRGECDLDASSEGVTKTGVFMRGSKIGGGKWRVDQWEVRRRHDEEVVQVFPGACARVARHASRNDNGKTSGSTRV